MTICHDEYLKRSVYSREFRVLHGKPTKKKKKNAKNTKIQYYSIIHYIITCTLSVNKQK